jgi:hypothetical protein
MIKDKKQVRIDATDLLNLNLPIKIMYTGLNKQYKITAPKAAENIFRMA